MNKKLIKKVFIDQSNMVAAGGNRQVTVFGEVGAEFVFNIIKINGTSKESYYNFKTNTFTEAFISANNLQVKLLNDSFSKVIVFPQDTSGEVYSIKTIAKEQTTKFSNGNFVDVKKINQVGQTSLFLQVPDDFNSDSKLTALPNPVQSTGSTALSTTVSVPVSFVLTNANTDAKGFGLKLPSFSSSTFTIPDSYWYVQKAVIVNGTHSSQTVINVDSTDQIVPGMELANVIVDNAKVFVVSVSATTITLSNTFSASNDVVIVFRAYGTGLIKSIFGIEVEFSGFVAAGTSLQKTVRTGTVFPTSNGNVTLNLIGTYGVGSGIRLTGFNLNGAGNNNLITTVSASSTAGSVVMNYAGSDQDRVYTIPVGTKLNVIGSYQVITITGVVKIKKYPESNAKIVLDLPSIVTVGTASP